jgi:ribosomal protein L37AE/L43A
MTAAQIEDRTYRERLDRAKADQPQWCPQCGSREVAPLFLDDVDVWDCARCFSIWSERD